MFLAIHPEFRLIMLANRPGFPFLGNDLFAVLGDLFSIHVVDNPSRTSELAMLKQYGPNVKDEHLQQLVSAFDELREMADNALLSYPYSTRELVNIVKHLQMYPDDPLTAVVRNVFDFDSYTKETTQSIEAVFQKYGIPLGIKNPEENVFLSRRFPIEEPRKLGEWKIKENIKPFLIEPKIVPLISEKEFDYKKYAFNLEMHHSRASMFSEQKFFWQLPISDVNICSDILDIGNGKLCVATVNPPTLYYIPDQRKASCVEIDLSQQFSKFLRGEFRPRFTLSNWNSNGVLMHEETTNTLLMVDFEKLKIYKLRNDESTVFGSIVDKFTQGSISNTSNHWRLLNHSERPILYNKGGNELQILFPGDLPAGAEIILLPNEFSISNILSASKDKILIAANKGTLLLTFESDGRVFLRPLTEDSDIPLHFETINKIQADSDNPNPSFMLSHEDFYAIKSENFPELMSSGEVFAWKRPSEEGKYVQEEIPYRSLKEKFPLNHPQKEVVIFDNGVLVRAIPKWKTPGKALPKNISPTAISGFLEVVDPRRNNVQYIPVPSTRPSMYHSAWVASISKTPFTISKGSDGKSLYTCETNGAIRKWEIDEIELMSSLQAWHKLFGTEDSNERIEFEKDETQIDMSKLTEPTLGKYDHKNNPHVGGNMWQGGTGGYNTAGLGGVGGPFRLDAGHDVHQIHEGAKNQVPEDYKRKAREINRREYQKRLRDIDMSEHDAETYETFKEKIKKQVTHMKSIIDSLEAREQERQWVKHQTSGDLDDAKLIEGLTGEKGIYRRRMEQPPEPGAIQTKPKRLRLVFDVSGSMYRFNGHDKRLQKSMEAALMVMEALEGKQDKIKYDIVGHSGDGPEMVFTTPDAPPTNEKQKYDVAKKMFLQSQFCYSGDFTLEALQLAISKVSKETDVDERFVIVLSDANLDRYGIKPHHLAKRLEADPKVHAFVILVGSLGAQADKLVKALPAGKAFYASDTAQLPHIIQNIFASTLIK
uniref:VWFA domain-containing protein n=2 Tax=Panagrolaimus davidi TaxID=227884 RepID=A0A914QPH8_9BILA